MSYSVYLGVTFDYRYFGCTAHVVGPEDLDVKSPCLTDSYVSAWRAGRDEVIKEVIDKVSEQFKDTMLYLYVSGTYYRVTKDYVTDMYDGYRIRVMNASYKNDQHLEHCQRITRFIEEKLAHYENNTGKKDTDIF